MNEQPKNITHVVYDHINESNCKLYVEEIQRLRQGLQDIASPLIALKRDADINGYRFDGSTAISIIDVEYLKNEAKKILETGDEYAKLC